MAYGWEPLNRDILTIALMAALIPGESPPEVKNAIGLPEEEAILGELE